jgi:hypothetical protein
MEVSHSVLNMIIRVGVLYVALFLHSSLLLASCGHCGKKLQRTVFDQEVVVPSLDTVDPLSYHRLLFFIYLTRKIR